MKYMFTLALRLLVGHFQNEQKSYLRGVSHVGMPIIAQFVVPALAGSQRNSA